VGFTRAAAIVLLAVAVWGTRQIWAGRSLPVTTHSRVAYEHYLEGTTAYARGDFGPARRAFERAITADSTFAMAEYYAALCAGNQNDDETYNRYYAAALRHALRAREGERLLIRATWAERNGDPDALALAESLADRHPEEPAGHDLLGRALLDGGDFLGAVGQLDLVAQADSQSLRPGFPGPCKACEALLFVSYAYWMADSLSAAERVARDVVRRRPGSAEAWHQLAATLETQYRFDEALAAAKTAANLRSGNQSDAVFPAVIGLRAGRLSQSEQRLRQLVRDTARAISNEARWNLIIALREQGRLAEALAEARRFRRGFKSSARVEWAIPEAQVLLELGYAHTAAVLFDSIGRAILRPSTPARQARNRTWHLTHVATALALTRDTTHLAALADTIEQVGTQSGYGRDHLLHHHARGLLLLARGRPADAVVEFERASFSWTGGFCRNNLELARAFERVGRVREAIDVLAAALHGPAEAGGLYCTFTELHAALGEAFQAAGRADSAAVHYRWVLDAWKRADSLFAGQRAAVRARLVALRR
jgi:tetratricopeptide (TPR) repeat protein